MPLVSKPKLFLPNFLSNSFSKLARIWENPSVKNYETQVREGDFTVVVGSDEIIGTRGNTKVASLNVASLDADV